MIPLHKLKRRIILSKGRLSPRSVGAPQVQTMIRLEKQKSASQFCLLGFCNIMRNVCRPSAMWKLELLR